MRSTYVHRNWYSSKHYMAAVVICVATAAYLAFTSAPAYEELVTVKGQVTAVNTVKQEQKYRSKSDRFIEVESRVTSAKLKLRSTGKTNPIKKGDFVNAKALIKSNNDSPGVWEISINGKTLYTHEEMARKDKQKRQIFIKLLSFLAAVFAFFALILR